VLVHGLLVVVEIADAVVLTIFVDFLFEDLHFKVHQVDLLLEIKNHLVLVVRNCVWVVAQGSVAHASAILGCRTFFFLASSEHPANRLVIGALKYQLLISYIAYSSVGRSNILDWVELVCGATCAIEHIRNLKSIVLVKLDKAATISKVRTYFRKFSNNLKLSKNSN
jgi:hypothetical protein